MEYIRELHDEGLTILMITHDIEEALMADRLVVLKDGAVFADGTAEHLFQTPGGVSRSLSRTARGAANLL
ncbi:MAG: hypothetical protein MZU97_14140 [Bacillus subtilis]|nr:hypothetical protein [Bacillus subtilis]